MEVKENTVFTREYYERDKRHIGNALHVFFSDGSKLEQRIDFPIGHRKRRAEGMPVLQAKFERSISGRLAPAPCRALIAAFADQRQLEAMPVDALMALMVKQIGRASCRERVFRVV